MADFTILGKRKTLSVAKLCKVDSAERMQFDRDSDGLLSKEEFGDYLKFAMDKGSGRETSKI